MKSNRNFRLYSSEEHLEDVLDTWIQLWQREKNAPERMESVIY